MRPVAVSGKVAALLRPGAKPASSRYDVAPATGSHDERDLISADRGAQVGGRIEHADADDDRIRRRAGAARVGRDHGDVIHAGRRRRDERCHRTDVERREIAAAGRRADEQTIAADRDVPRRAPRERDDAAVDGRGQQHRRLRRIARRDLADAEARFVRGLSRSRGVESAHAREVLAGGEVAGHGR